MFKCDRCGHTSESGQKMNKVIVETRPTIYFEKVFTNDGYVNGKEIGRGTEIVREIKICNKCNNKENK